MREENCREEPTDRGGDAMHGAHAGGDDGNLLPCLPLPRNPMSFDIFLRFR